MARKKTEKTAEEMVKPEKVVKPTFMEKERKSIAADQTQHARETKLAKLAKRDPVIRELLDRIEALSGKASRYDALTDSEKESAVLIKELQETVKQQKQEIVELNLEIDKIADEKAEACSQLQQIDACLANEKTA